MKTDIHTDFACRFLSSLSLLFKYNCWMITGCGGVIELSSGESQTIRSPNYPNAVPVDRECVWLVKARVTDNLSSLFDI